MLERLLHVIYAIEFLVALVAIYTVWGQVGGQGHLDLMAWYWKAGLGFPAAYAILRLTVAIGADGPRRRRRSTGWTLLLVLLALGASLITYYSHLNEPQDENDQDEGAVTPAALHLHGADAAGTPCGHPVRRRRLL